MWSESVWIAEVTSGFKERWCKSADKYYIFHKQHLPLDSMQRPLSNKLDLPPSNSPTHEVLACGGPPQLPL